MLLSVSHTAEMLPCRIESPALRLLQLFSCSRVLRWSNRGNHVTMQSIRFNLKAREFWLVWVAFGVYGIAFAIVLMIAAPGIPVA